jgi:hypothetical protein
VKPRSAKCGFLVIATMFFSSCGSDHPNHPNHPVALVTEKRPTILTSDLPTQFLDAIDTSSNGTIKEKLKNQDSLVLDGTTLTIGPVGGNRTVTLAFNTFKLINGARIVTNGNHLTLIAMNFESNNSGGIDSFYGETLKAPTGANGANGGRVEINAIEAVTGSLRIALPGQDGGDGTPGGVGSAGGVGPRGANGVDHMFDCAHGGTDGGQGGTGGTGLTGGAGGAGGNGGDLVLRGEAVKNHESHFPYEASPGRGGSGGPGGTGGPGGPGGEGGSGSTHCGGGHSAPVGIAGQQGPNGLNGSNGTSSGKRQLN